MLRLFYRRWKGFLYQPDRCLYVRSTSDDDKKILPLPRIKFLSANQQQVALLTYISHFMKRLIVHLITLPQLYCLQKLNEKLLNNFEQRFREE